MIISHHPRWNSYYKVMSNTPKMGQLPSPVTGWQWMAILFGKSPHNSPVPADRRSVAPPAFLQPRLLGWSSSATTTDQILFGKTYVCLGWALLTIISPVKSGWITMFSTTWGYTNLFQSLEIPSLWSHLPPIHITSSNMPTDSILYWPQNLAVLGKGHSYGHIPWNSHSIIIKSSLKIKLTKKST